MTTAGPNDQGTPVEAYLEDWGDPTPIPAPTDWWQGWEEARQPQLDQEARTERVDQPFDALNPDFGLPADQVDPVGQRAVQDRERGLALGTRAAAAALNEAHPDPSQRVAAISSRGPVPARRVDRLRQARADRLHDNGHPRGERRHRHSPADRQPGEEERSR